MCRVLKLNRSTYYYTAKEIEDESWLVDLIKQIFHKNRRVYGTRKIKKELEKEGHQVSRRRIGRIMKHEGLVSRYTVAQYNPIKDTCNESKIDNVINREFDDQPHLNVVVSDLTYVRVGSSWNYICILIDLFNREIIGFSAGKYKDVELVRSAFRSIKGDLRRIRFFHTDRGNEFKNKVIDEILTAFDIQRSLSRKGCPYDNAVAEATFKIIKTEFVKGQIYDSLEQLQLELFDYVNWFNNIRIHSSLGYLTPSEYARIRHEKIV